MKSQVCNTPLKWLQMEHLSWRSEERVFLEHLQLYQRLQYGRAFIMTMCEPELKLLA